MRAFDHLESTVDVQIRCVITAPCGPNSAKFRAYRLQESVFLTKLAPRLDEVPAPGQRVRLGNAGNHAQGCLFLDGERLRTPALEAWVIAACRNARGFHYGRLDVRFPDEAACMRGEGGVILEANGVTSESTNMYDPSFGALRAWRIMYRHWAAAFRIGAAHRRGGVQGIGLREVLRRRRRWLAGVRQAPVSDRSWRSTAASDPEPSQTHCQSMLASIILADN